MIRQNRREMIATLGAFGGTLLLTGCDSEVPPPTPESEKQPVKWSYTRLDPAEARRVAYRIFPEGGCMYAVVGGVVGTLAKRVGEPFKSFPLNMMRYGERGLAGQKSLCGAVNGCTALIGLFHDEKTKEKREELIEELCLWYKQTELPKFKPDNHASDEKMATTIADSLLCCDSAGKWCKASGSKPASDEQKERCRRLTADCVMKTVEILNAELNG